MKAAGNVNKSVAKMPNTIVDALTSAVKANPY